MSDLDIQIDVPDDDDLGSSVRVLNGDSIPPWLKAAAIVVLAGLTVLTVGAFLLGRFRGSEDPLIVPTSSTSPIVSAEASPAIENSLEAIQDWEQFTSDGDLSAVSRSFDPAGPQFAMFRQSPISGPDSEVDFSALNLSETVGGEMTTVSFDLVVTTDGTAQTYPFDFVYLEGSELVWTVIDRRSPGTVALPPTVETVGVITQVWEGYTASLALGDGAGVARSVSTDSQILGDQVASGAADNPVDQPIISDRQLFDLLVSRARQASAADSGHALIAMLDDNQRQAFLTGELTSWTQIDDSQVIASLEVAGQPVATVPFVASADGWSFDLKGALESSGGGSQ